MGNTIKLKMTAGQEHELLPLQKIDERDTLMYPAYREAARALCGIIKSAKRFNSSCGSSNQKSNLYNYANNTIAFCGSRGQGKTSTMLSFGNALRGEGVSSILNELDPEKMIADSRFHVMDPIDPTMLKKGGHITEIVLSYLYGQMRRMFDGGKGRDLSTREREKELRRFQQSIGWLSRSSDRIDRSDDFYDFEKPGHGFDIKENLYHIIDSFLQLDTGEYDREAYSRPRHPGKELFLVIMLDDMDLQLENSYDILEEVRQYLQLPNTIVLMAADIVQLRRTIAMHYSSQMSTALKYELMDQDEIHRLTAKYMDKLIPAAQTIYLPEYKPTICRGNDIIVEFADEGTESLEKAEELHTKFFEMIFRKTSLVFVRHQSYVNNLFPATLRGLRQLYRLLDSMPEPCIPDPLPDSFWKGGSSEDLALRDRKVAEGNRIMMEYLKQRLSRVRQLESNLAVFKAYFLGDWCASKLDCAGEKVLNKISRSAAPASFSAALRELNKWCKKAYPDDLNSRYPSAAGAEDDEGSYSKLCIQLRLVAEKGDESAYLLAFAVHTYFSIQLTEQALQEQRDQIEKKFAAESSHQNEEVLRFILDYRKLEDRFEEGLFSPDTCKLFLGSEVDPAMMHRIFHYYRRYLRKRNKGHNESRRMDNRNTNTWSIDIWQYWDRQDWAVQFCCNWELQEYALKYLKKKQSAAVNVNELNEALLEKAPICGVNDDGKREILTKEYTIFFPQDNASSAINNITPPNIDNRITPPEKRLKDIQSALDLLDEASSIVGQYSEDSSSKAKTEIRTASVYLRIAMTTLTPYIRETMRRKLYNICDQLDSEFPIGSDVSRQLGTLHTQVKNLLNTDPPADSSADK